MQINNGNVNLLENGRIKSFFLFSTRRAAQTKKLEFLLKLVTLNVCARGSRDFPATPHPTDTVFVPGLSSRIPNLNRNTDNTSFFAGQRSLSAEVL